MSALYGLSALSKVRRGEYGGQSVWRLRNVAASWRCCVVRDEVHDQGGGHVVVPRIGGRRQTRGDVRAMVRH